MKPENPYQFLVRYVDEFFEDKDNLLLTIMDLREALHGFETDYGRVVKNYINRRCYGPNAKYHIVYYGGGRRSRQHPLLVHDYIARR